MRRQALICGVIGHRWSTAAEVHEPFPVLQCLRCGSVNMLTSDTALGDGLRRVGETADTVRDAPGDRWQPKSRRCRPPHRP